MSLKLYQLIHSLTGAEKRYFKLHTQLIQTHKPKQYLNLFELLGNMPVYDEEVFVTGLKRYKLNPKNVHSDKNYLYESVLDILTKFHAENSGGMKILNLLAQVEILYRKNLPEQAAIQLRKAKKIANKYNVSTYNLPIIEWSQRLAGFPETQNILETQNIGYEEEIKQFTHFIHHDFLYKKAHLLRKKISKTKDENTLKIWHKNIANHRIFNAKNPPKSLHTQIRYYQIKAAHFYVTDDVQNEFETNREMLRLMQSHPHFISEYPEEYVAIFSRYLVLTKSVDLDLYFEALAQFRAIPQQIKHPTPALQAKIFTLYQGTEITRLIYARHFDAAEALLPEIKAGFERYQKHIKAVYLLASHYRSAYIYVALGKFTLALKEVNHIALMNKNLRPDLFRFTKLLTLIIHFELGNKTLIPYLKKSINLYYYKQEKVHELERLFLKYITKFHKALSKEILREQFIEFQEKLNVLLQKEAEKKALLYFDFTLWVAAKLAGKTMSKFAENKSSEILLT